MKIRKTHKLHNLLDWTGKLAQVAAAPVDTTEAPAGTAVPVATVAAPAAAPAAAQVAPQTQYSFSKSVEWANSTGDSAIMTFVANTNQAAQTQGTAKFQNDLDMIMKSMSGDANALTQLKQHAGSQAVTVTQPAPVPTPTAMSKQHEVRRSDTLGDWVEKVI